MNDPLMPLSFTRTRSEAMALGLKLYFTGKPCKHGHLAERRCPSGSCVECDSGHQKSAVGRSGAIARAKQWRVQHPKQHGQHFKKWADKNRESIRFQQQDYRKHNREILKIRNKKNYAANPSAYTLAARNRELAKLQRTPSWANSEAIAFFYKHRPAGFHVDHIIPLQGKTVSGLHVETNLQWLPAFENGSKHNRFSSDAHDRDVTSLKPHAVASSRASRPRETGKRRRAVAA